MEAGEKTCDRNAAILSAFEKREMLDTLAGMIASTIEGASVEDVHAALASSEAVSGEWRELVEHNMEARQKQNFFDAASSMDRASAAQQSLVPLAQIETTTWECPDCGAQQEVVDVHKSLRHSSTSTAVKTLSDTTLTGCPVCGSGGRREEESEVDVDPQ
ncbi:hypothetical protein TraAM80_06817 [Trypanosoma rangeli]|uniref:Uncharacterized protein n=1 Tax=Trypanosoma rangeli TaxID=5698 RepID=A0A422N893_TRYRA|nr:uncharacterized protein TraAM80_06817 [Trypanosoma rangeli]RNF01694.1 hypothetical protein TraAM80_06817 [Trypanosoma rangeli]|eukprot:RNF01694.1 hypothetical protein TraAM80_06817 [Trypanosoma rangeli]